MIQSFRKETKRDHMMMLSLNVHLNRRHSNPDMLQGEQNMVMSHLDALSERGKVPEKMGTYTHLAPLQTPTDVKDCQIANSAMSIPNSGQSSNTVEGDPGHAKSATEGGALWEYLLSKAISHHDELPDLMNVRDWTTKDIGKLSAKDQRAWCKAQFEELEALKKHNIYELADLPPGCKAIKNHWVFNLKSDGRKKACLVAKGFSQIEGLDFDKIFSPVVQFESVRTILVLAALEKWKIEGLDVKSAFLYGTLDEELYMEQPQGFKVLGNKHKVLCLKKAIYGLKQAARAWWHELNRSLKALGFSRLYADAGIFVAKHADRTMVIILAYVDDIILTGPNTTLVASKEETLYGQMGMS